MNKEKIMIFSMVFLFLYTPACHDDHDVREWNSIPKFRNHTVGPILAMDSVIVFAGDSLGATLTFEAFISKDEGLTWKSIQNGLPTDVGTHSLGSLKRNDTTFIFAGTFGKGIYRSVDYGITWQEINAGLDTTRLLITAFVSCEDLIYVSTSPIQGPSKVFVSGNAGQSWNEVTSFSCNGFGSGTCKNGTIFMARTDCGVSYSSDRGQTWGTINNNSNVGLDEIYIQSIASNGSYIFAVNNYRIYSSTNNGSSWTFLGPQSFASGNILSMNDSLVSLDGIFYSRNFGKTWVKRVSGLPETFVTEGVAFLKQKIFLSLGWKGLWVNETILKN